MIRRVGVCLVFLVLNGCINTGVSMGSGVDTPLPVMPPPTTTIIVEHGRPNQPGLSTPTPSTPSPLPSGDGVLLLYAPQYCPQLPIYPTAQLQRRENDETPGSIRRTAWYHMKDSPQTIFAWYRALMSATGWQEEHVDEPTQKQQFGYYYPPIIRDSPVTVVRLFIEHTQPSETQLQVEISFSDAHSFSVWCPSVQP